MGSAPGVGIVKRSGAISVGVGTLSWEKDFASMEMTAVDAVSREYDMHKFDQIVSELQKEALIAEIKLDIHVMDMRLSAAKAFVEFASKNNVDLMVVGSISDKTWTKHFTSDISQEIMDLNPPCNVILIE